MPAPGSAYLAGANLRASRASLSRILSLSFFSRAISTGSAKRLAWARRKRSSSFWCRSSKRKAVSDIGNGPFRTRLQFDRMSRCGADALGWGVAGQRPDPKHRHHPMRSDITQHIASSGQCAAPEGPGPQIFNRTDSLLFQAKPVRHVQIGVFTGVEKFVMIRPLAVPEPDARGIPRVRHAILH